MNLDRRLFRLAATVRLFFPLAVLAGFLMGIAAVFQARQLSQIISRVFIGGQSLHDVIPLMWAFLLIITGRQQRVS